MTYGVRKVNEYIVKDGRALIMTQDVPTSISQAQWDSISDGTAYINPIDGTLQFKKRGNSIKEWSKFEPINIFNARSIEGRMLCEKTITNDCLAESSVDSRVLNYNAVSGPIIQNQAMENRHFKVNSINGNILLDNSIDGSKFSSIDGSKIEDRTIPGSAIQNNSIGHDAIQSKSITNDLIAENAIDNRTIQTKTITTGCIADGAIQNLNLAENSVDNRVLAVGAVDYDCIKNNAIRESALATHCVSTRALGTGVVNTDALSDGAVTSSKIAFNEIRNYNIKDSEIQISKLSQDLSNKINNAVVLENGTARVKGDLQVDYNIRSTSNNQSYSITGFKVFNPVFADYAEGFIASEPVEAGDIVEIDKNHCIKKAEPSSTKIIGVVSEQFGLCLDASEDEIENGSKVAVGLIGKVPINIIGSAEPGDFIISCGEGTGYATKTFMPGRIVGKALESKKGYEIGKVLCLINIM